ncbi:MAG: hypothetical protein KIT58_00760 [Planctomycetota bacterium]|nr:hypothetical protein [Planctomycetota bacterium]
MTQGPTELHGAIIADPQTERLALDDAAVLRLLWVAYGASCSPDEGRFPRVLLFVPLEGREATYLLFRPSVPLTESALRRLAPGVPGRPHGLIVGLKGGELVLRGTAIPEGTGYRVDDGRASWFTMNSHALGLFLEIMGPGHLLVTDRSRQPCFTHRLRSCEVATVWDVTSATPFRQVVDRIMDLARRGGGILGRESLRGIVGSFLAQLLRIVIDTRHGGAFAIVPAGFDVARSKALGTRRVLIVPLDKGVLGILDGGDNRFGVTKKNDDEWESHHVHEALADLRTYARSVAALAAMDGTVLLAQNLAVVGAGIMTAGSKLPRCVEVDHAGRDDREFPVRSLGSRNQAAARFCAGTGATMFVISEDGDLRIYYRKGKGTVAVMPNVGLHAGSSPAFE